MLSLTASGVLFAQEQADIATKGVEQADVQGAASASTADKGVVLAGEALFRENCAVCHGMNDVVVGPALKDVHKRRSKAWLTSWIRNSTQMVQSGDKEAVAVFNEFNKQQMPSFAFSDDEMNAVLLYIEEQSKIATTAPTGEGSNPSAGPGDQVGTDAIGSISNYLDIVLIVLIVVLIVMVVTLLLISSMLRSYLNSKKDLDEHDAELVNQRIDFAKIYKSKPVRVVAGLILLIVILDATIEGVMGIGIQQGYAPKQPIAFSHKLHAGDHQINCNYCHTTVYKSKSASIPSANICMNCHSQIKKESAEIQKIYRAIERNKPIEWVRIHNLPDLAYFNHSQHTNVAGVECQTCHGPIETMEVVAQYSPLTMGWCIECHRETPLNTQGNGYYDKLVKMHESESKEAFTVASNGGTECSKCHY
ncbi:MAG: c-type cytochrome [Hymenobacteraceae bacterium]|nr:c-type cytochrome [Hymenobacteraceae bacterium]MDX5396872.1 c-type cytochrome [Hymenobacteraceae bacterium]MDX5512943.1 c-type cytochrome [Hymenobacteraceae bacterium]